MGEMPKDCNALVRLDKELEYCKLNCKWDFVSQGRPRVGSAPKKKKSTLKKRIKKPKTVCITLEEKHYEYIKKQAIMKSSQEGNIVQTNDLIRDALIKAFPLPELYDLFGSSKK